VSSAEVHSPRRDAAVGQVDFHLEVEIIPVSDVDRSKEFYQRPGWRLDGDVAPLDGLRIVQFTPPGSAASVMFGTGLTAPAPGSAEGVLIVSDIEAAHDELAGRGIDASEIRRGPPFPAEARQPGPEPQRTSYGSFFSFTHPNGNTWLVQEVTTRLPGRIDTAGTVFASSADLASALRRAEAVHAEHQKRAGRRRMCFASRYLTLAGHPAISRFSLACRVWKSSAAGSSQAEWNPAPIFATGISGSLFG
jgi:hypothetical protein